MVTPSLRSTRSCNAWSSGSRAGCRPYNLPTVAKAFIYATLPLLVVLNWLAFRYFGVNYFLWFLAKGPVIALSTSFVALIWSELDAQNDLVSLNPVRYLIACFVIAGVTFQLAGAELNRPRSAAGRWDQFFNLLLMPFVGMVTLAWVFVVGPLQYFVHLVAGAPARRALRGESDAVLVEEREASGATKAWTLRFAEKPFATTQALSALLLWLVRLGYERLG